MPEQRFAHALEAIAGVEGWVSDAHAQRPWVRREDRSPGARALNALKRLARLPSFARNILVKLALLARMRRLAWLLSQRTGEWPY